ncbi:MAG: lytic transglycosylase domain-containing protein [Alkalilacustris sp.]
MRSIIGVAAGLCLLAETALGQSGQPASAERMRQLEAQSRLLDGRLAQQYSHSVRLLPPSSRRDAAIPRWQGSYSGPYLALAREAARRHAIPEDLFLRLVQRESAWNARAVSHKGAVGLAQLMPGTAALLRVDIDRPDQNLDGGARYLRMMHDRFGDWRLALAAYNAGPEAVARHGGVPPYAETRAYVAAILGD